MNNPQQNRVLITGSTGFIGNFVIKELLKYNIEIIATGTKPKNRINHDWLSKVVYIQADLNQDCEDWYKFFGKPDVVIHLAWQGLPNYNEKFHLDKNFSSSYKFLKNLVLSGCKDIVVTGTCFEYGMQNGSLHECLESMPITYYAIAKDKLRKLLQEFQKKKNFNLKWIRLFYMYGKGQSSGSILSQLDSAILRKDKIFNMSEGEQLRDYLPVEKIAEYIVKISLQNIVYGIINCCSGYPISIKQLIKNYLTDKKYNIELNLGYYPYNEYEPMEYWGDTKKLNVALGK